MLRDELVMALRQKGLGLIATIPAMLEPSQTRRTQTVLPRKQHSLVLQKVVNCPSFPANVCPPAPAQAPIILDRRSAMVATSPKSISSKPRSTSLCSEAKLLSPIRQLRSTSNTTSITRLRPLQYTTSRSRNSIRTRAASSSRH